MCGVEGGGRQGGGGVSHIGAGIILSASGCLPCSVLCLKLCVYCFSSWSGI